MHAKHDPVLEAATRAPLSWDPELGGKRAWICFEDEKTYDIGPDTERVRFQEISKRMLSGHYYPKDAVVFRGKFSEEGRNLRVGDRIVQTAPLLGKLGGPKVHASAEIYIAELEENRCKIGYVTTVLHPGRGIWTAELMRQSGRLTLRVSSIASPNTWMFWLGLPYARYLQLRARSRAVEEFMKV